MPAARGRLILRLSAQLESERGPESGSGCHWPPAVVTGQPSAVARAGLAAAPRAGGPSASTTGGTASASDAELPSH